MKIITKIFIAIILVFAILFFMGYLLPSDKMITRKLIIDKMYFFVMMDIGGHFEEASWRPDLDTTIQQEDMDGLQVWLEKYTNGDSLLLKTIKVTEFDIVRETIEPKGKNRLRVIQIKDYNGKTAIKMTEEVYIKSPFKRLWYLIDDKSGEFVDNYLKDLKAKYENEEDNTYAF